MANDDKARRRRAGDLDPDAEMWAALMEGRLLRRILEDFYGEVFRDARLAPFFAKITKDRAIDKQYEFLRDKFTGTRDYFGDRPRNAHHWMVISDELFDYREELLAAHARAAGLEERFIRRWRALDERFRKQIVKARPIPKKIRGRPLPLEGFEELTLSVGALCDGCQREIDVGERVRFHVRTGATFCRKCASSKV
jgi:truncated hemoglobin YjbI